MKFSNKKILFALVVILTIAAGAIFYWQKTHIPPVSPISPDISSESVKEKCLEEVSEMDEKQLIEEINTLPFATGEDLKSINKQMVNYLSCDLERDRTEEAYNRVRELTDRLRIPEEKKAEALKTIDEVYLASPELRSFATELALGDIEVICPDRLSQLCIEAYGKEACLYDYCKLIDEYDNNEESFNKEMIDYNYWSQISFRDEPVTTNRIAVRVAMILRLRGEDTTRQFCETLPEIQLIVTPLYSLTGTQTTMRDFCLQELKKLIGNCQELRQSISELICDL